MIEHGITDYAIASGSNEVTLSDHVRELLECGYQPHGSMVIDTSSDDGFLYQPMVRYSGVRNES